MPATVELAKDQTVKTEDDVIDVRFPAGAPAVPGVYVFELVVVDDLEAKSDPAIVRITLRGAANADIRPADANGNAIDRVVFKPGEPILLTGRGSKSENGKIRTFLWTLKERP